jgi:penicillin-binding protein 1A
MVGETHQAPRVPRASASSRPLGQARRWRRALVRGAVVGALAPFVAAAVLWPLTPSVAAAPRLVAATLRAHHAAGLRALPVPDRVGRAVIATEDSRFYSHPGIDPIDLLRAARNAVTAGNDPGGATLDQQLAKLLIVPGDGALAKLEQAEVAVKLDAAYSKSQLLRMYLSAVYFGHGYYGLPAAARGYFGRTPATLTWAQASLLAGLVQAPSAYDPYAHHALAKSRQAHVLGRLVATGVLTRAAARAAYRAPLGLR